MQSRKKWVLTLIMVFSVCFECLAAEEKQAIEKADLEKAGLEKQISYALAKHHFQCFHEVQL